MNVKQCIVIRKDLKMRRGKEIAQGAHSSMMFLTKKNISPTNHDFDIIDPLSEVERYWLDHSFKKICLQVESEQELIKVFDDAVAAGLTVHLVTDSGLTEFKGPTKTCLAIGPDLDEKIDKITGGLKLY